MVCTLPGDRLCENLNKIKEMYHRRYPLCENFNKTGFLVVCSIFYSTGLKEFPIESSYPCYYGIAKRCSKVLIYIIIHCHSQSSFYFKKIHIILIQEFFLSYLSLFGYFLKV